MQLDPRFVIHSVFHDAEQSLVRALTDDDRFTDQLVTTEASRRRHRSRVAICTCVESRVETTKIRSLCLSPPTLRSHGEDARASDDEDTLVFNKFAVLYEQNTPMNVENFALSILTTILFDVILMPNFGSVTIGGNSVSIPAGDLRHLGME
jgi:hypothetical protein